MANQGPAPRNWLVDGDPLPVPPDGDEMFDALVEAWSILHRLGGSLVAVAQREQVSEDLYVTTSIALQWKPFAPAKRQPQPEPEPVQANGGSEVTVEQG